MDYQTKIDQMVVDQYSVIGKLHQLSFMQNLLRTHATEAVDYFSNFDDDEHTEFMMAVQESLDAIGIMEEALEDTKNLLHWMRQRRSEIFKEQGV